MTREEKKKYILKQWRGSSGKRISEMLRRYWASEQSDTSDALIEHAKQLFK